MSDLDLSELRAGIRPVLEGVCGHEALRRHIDSDAPFLAALREEARALGWFGLVSPEEAGGLALHRHAGVVLNEELGRAASPLPIVGALMAGRALALTGAAGPMAERIAAGEAVVGVSAGDAAPTLKLSRAGALSGAARLILDGADADLFLLQADADDGAAWVLVARDMLAVTPTPLVDRTRSMAEARCDGVKIDRSRMFGADVARALRIEAAMALAGDAVGGAAAVLEMTIAYLKTREQFGRPIGSFQALKHRCADHAVALEAAKALVEDAAAHWDGDDAAMEAKAALVKAHACETYAAIAADAVQLHGGIGFTWEHPCHIYLKRAKLNQALFGTAAAHRDRAARLIAGEARA
jgi:alkylation response protein AidB-like acyl-CoA dehydrogenase